MILITATRFWVGGWDFLTLRMKEDGTRARYFELFADSKWRETFYLIIGLGLMAATDTLYGNAGFLGGYFPPKSPFLEKKSVMMLRATIGLFGSLLLWTGMYGK